jgi:hypothetical protein
MTVRGFSVLVSFLIFTAASVFAGSGDPNVLAQMERINRELAQRGLGIAVEQIEFFTIGGGRRSNRIHQQEFRWAPNDDWRLAEGKNITYLVDQSDGATASGLTSVQTEAAIDDSLTFSATVEDGGAETLALLVASPRLPRRP